MCVFATDSILIATNVDRHRKHIHVTIRYNDFRLGDHKVVLPDPTNVDKSTYSVLEYFSTPNYYLTTIEACIPATSDCIAS